MLRCLVSPGPSVGRGAVYFSVRHHGNKKSVGNKKISPKEQKRREMLMLMGRSAMFDLENKPKKEDILYSRTVIKKAMKPVIVPEEVEDERAQTEQDYTRGRMHLHRSQLLEMRLMVQCRRNAMQELLRLSVGLYRASTTVRRKEMPFKIASLPETPPIPDYSPPTVSLAAR